MISVAPCDSGLTNIFLMTETSVRVTFAFYDKLCVINMPKKSVLRGSIKYKFNVKWEQLSPKEKRSF